MYWPLTEIGRVNFDKQSRQHYDKWICRFLLAKLRSRTLLQMIKGTECDIAAVTMGNDELSSLGMLSVFIQ